MRMLITCAAAGGALVSCIAVALARSGDNAATAYAGTTWPATLGMLAAALALFGAAVVARAPATAALTLAAGICWLAPIAAAWPAGPPVLRATATIAATFTFPLLAHLALAAPAGRLDGRTARPVIAAA